MTTNYAEYVTNTDPIQSQIEVMYLGKLVDSSGRCFCLVFEDCSPATRAEIMATYNTMCWFTEDADLFYSHPDAVAKGTFEVASMMECMEEE